jgi:hypothetical protein
MARTGRAAAVTTTAQRRRLPARAAPWWRPVRLGLRVGYRKTKDGQGGSWLARLALPGGKIAQRALGLADDTAPADGRTVLDWTQAVEAALAFARDVDAHGTASTPRGGASTTVRDALVRYRSDKLESGQRFRVSAVGTVLDRHVPDDLLSTPLPRLTASQLRAWVAGLRGVGGRQLSQGRIDSLCGVMKAALRAAKASPEALAGGLGAAAVAAVRGGRAEATARKMILDRGQIERCTAPPRPPILTWRCSCGPST